MDSNQDLPIYELAEASAVNGLVEPTGYRFTFMGWPLPSYKPVNASAREVVDYYRRVKGTGACADSPMRGGRLHLPPLAVDRTPRYVVAAPKAGSGMIYSAATYAAHGTSVMPGQVYDTIEWPTIDMRPVNDAAKAVVAYYEQHRDDPNLPPKAWDAERQCVRTVPTKAA